MKFILIVFLISSCAVTDSLFGPYKDYDYCSGMSMDEIKRSRKNFEIPRKTNMEEIVEFFYEKDENLNKCFKKYTVSKVKSRYYCTVVTMTQIRDKNSISYISIDNKNDGLNPMLRSCLEDEIEKIKNKKLTSYEVITFHYPLKLSK